MVDDKYDENGEEGTSNLEELLQNAVWPEMVRGNEFATICERAGAYYEVVKFYRKQPIHLLYPPALLMFLWCFFKVKTEAQAAWQLVKLPETHPTKEQKELIASIQRATLINCFGKSKRAQRINML